MTDNRKDVTNNEVINFHPITCFPIMRKLLTGMIAGELHKPLEQAELLPGEQRGCRKKKKRNKRSADPWQDGDRELQGKIDKFSNGTD